MTNAPAPTAHPRTADAGAPRDHATPHPTPRPPAQSLRRPFAPDRTTDQTALRDSLALYGRTRADLCLHVYVANFAGSTVPVINTATSTITATAPVGGQPVGVAITPARRTTPGTSCKDGTAATPSPWATPPGRARPTPTKIKRDQHGKHCDHHGHWWGAPLAEPQVSACCVTSVADINEAYNRARRQARNRRTNQRIPAGERFVRCCTRLRIRRLQVRILPSAQQAEGPRRRSGGLSRRGVRPAGTARTSAAPPRFSNPARAASV
ncbi:hypothetical protein ACIP98_16350 [Streptomyces sp. NPDC088354]|uniref:hypothetical protein n=1 Tax=Streptomyces sp. NPDC088354 TaxID=3365856 RepID=UPI003830ECAF